ncbi:hypothetical protein J8281_03505 [Aquimarina sp. U1-2]|uniref:hypothetical protein n=1 Tax=Aquimarina sp. U1-2 TaxID=2823141 RepID=UPI001AED0220|nr:hypothetical protein [Aquimarina sp. U1-2]MBP2831244.1 hypothetical protein [Aquimarina sp. U1-2]
MISINEQLAFLELESHCCERVYKFLLLEFGEKNIAVLGKELKVRHQHLEALIQSLRELQTKSTYENH